MANALVDSRTVQSENGMLLGGMFAVLYPSLGSQNEGWGPGPLPHLAGCDHVCSRRGRCGERSAPCRIPLSGRDVFDDSCDMLSFDS